MPTFLPVISDTKQSSSGCGTCGTAATSETLQQEQRLRALDEEFERITRTMDAPAAESRVAERSFQRPQTVESRLSSHAPLPLVAERSHRIVEGRHLWVGVHEGAVMVLTDSEHLVFERLDRGERVDDVARYVSSTMGLAPEAGWNRVAQVIGRAAAAGFVKGIQGYTAHTPPKPEKFARLHVTKVCQLECIHCYADSSPHVDRQGELPVSRWRSLIGEYAALRAEEVLFTGGEALVYKGCLDLMAHARAHGLKVTLFSNGILVPKYIDRIKGSATKVQISLDGPDVASNDAIRGNGSYSRAVRAIDALLDAGVKTVVSMSVMHENWDAWKQGFSAFAERYAGALEFRVSYGVMQYGRGTQLREVEVEETRGPVDNYLSAFNGALGARVTRTKSGCGYGEQLVVGPDGTVYPCHLLDAKLCHIDDYPLANVIARLKGVSELFDVDHIEGCNTCDIRYLCGGKCRVIEGRKIGTRLVTTCTPEEKGHKLRNLVRSYGGLVN